MIATNETRTVRCAIYTRKSTEENLDLDFNSLDAQRESAEAYIKSQEHEGWRCLPDRYDDGGFSGGNTERPAFQRLMADVEDGKIDCILVYKIDRLSRSLMDFARIMEKMDLHQVSLVSVTQQFNTTTSMGRLTLNVLLSFAQFEREIISERTRDKIAAARRKGKWSGGPPILGYDRQKDDRGSRLLVNQEEAERVRAIFQLYLEQGSLGPTLAAMQVKEWKTKRFQTTEGRWRGGQVLDKSSLQKMLTNITYLGKVRFKGEIFEGEHEAIVDEDLFGQVQGQLARNRNSGGTHGRNKHGATLKGLVRCKHCGCGMSHHFARKGNKQYRYYVCVRAQKGGWSSCPFPSLPALELEDFVVDQIRSLGKDPGILQASVRAAQSQLQTEIDALRSKRASVDGRMRTLGREIGALAPRAGFDEGATEELARLQDSMREGQQESAGINEQMQKIKQRMLNPDELAGAVEAFDPMWDALPPSQKTKLVHLLVDRIEYDGQNESISITFHETGIKSFIQQERTCQAN